MLHQSPIPPLRSVSVHLSVTGKGPVTNQERENQNDYVEEDDDCEERNKAKDETEEQKAEESKNEGQEKEQEQGEKEEEEEIKKHKTERQESNLASETQSSPLLCLNVLSGADPELGPQLLEAAASGKI